MGLFNRNAKNTQSNGKSYADISGYQNSQEWMYEMCKQQMMDKGVPANMTKHWNVLSEVWRRKLNQAQNDADQWMLND